MEKGPLVSVIIIFLNAEQFIEEAIESVLNQSYNSIELLLVDDGSQDESTAIARRYAEMFPAKVFYLEHPNHQNCGMGAARNLGISKARGEYIAFLDADDVWLPHKLEQQTAILLANPSAGMLYGDTLYWYSWTLEPEDAERDFIPQLGVPPDTLIAPPKLMPLYIRGQAAVPCTCSIILRKKTVDDLGGFEEEFIRVSNIYEDQAFYAKVCLNVPVIAANICWDRYRQHPNASVAVKRKMDQETEARRFFLNWLRNYIKESEVVDLDVWQALRREEWRLHHPDWLQNSRRAQYLLRWIKKWLLRIEEIAAPRAVQNWLWRQD